MESCIIIACEHIVLRWYGGVVRQGALQLFCYGLVLNQPLMYSVGQCTTNQGIC